MARHKEFDPEFALGLAMDLFWERGYKRASMRELVERMGVGRRSLCDTFGDKHALFRQSLQRYAALQEAAGREMAAAASDSREAILRLLESSLAGDVIMRRGCLAVNTAAGAASSDHEVAERLARHFAASRRLLRDLIERGRSDGSVRVDCEPGALAAVLLDASIGLRVRVAMGACLDQLRAELNDVLDLLD